MCVPNYNIEHLQHMHVHCILLYKYMSCIFVQFMFFYSLTISNLNNVTYSFKHGLATFIS